MSNYPVMPFDGSGKLQIANSAGAEVLFATSTKQSDGSQKTQVVDAGGNTIGSFGSPSTISDYHSPTDYTATNTSAGTITIGTLPTGLVITDASQIVYVRQVNTTTHLANVYTNGAGGYKFGYAANVITIYKDGAILTTLTVNDKYDVGINGKLSVGVNQNREQLQYNPPATMLAEYRSPTDFTVVFTSNVTLTVAGAPFTVDDSICRITSIMYKNAAGVFAGLYNGRGGVSITCAANVITVAGAGTPFVNTDTVYDVNVIAQRKAYDPTTDTTKITNQSPDSNKFMQDSPQDTTNVTTGTVYYPSTLGASMDGYSALSVSGKIIDADNTTTITIEATNDEDATNADWVDVTKVFNDDNAGVATSIGASITVTNATKTFAVSKTMFNYSLYRFKLVTGDSTNTVIIKTRKIY